MQDETDFRGRRRFQCAQFGWAESPLWHSRTRHGRHPQWPISVEDSTIWIGVSDFQRLRPRRDPFKRADGNPGDLHLYPRFYWSWGGWAYSPAGGASCVPTCDPWTHYSP